MDFLYDGIYHKSMISLHIVLDDFLYDTIAFLW